MIRAKLSIGIVVAAALAGSAPAVAGSATKLKVSPATAADAASADPCVVRDGKNGRWYQSAAGKWLKCKLSGGNWSPAQGGGLGGVAPVVGGVAGAGGLAALAAGGGNDETPASP